MRPAQRKGLCIGAMVLTAGVFAAWQLWPAEQPLPEGVDFRNYQLAKNRFIRLFDRQPDHYDTLMMLGESAAADGHSKLALAAFQAVSVDHPAYGAAAQLQQALMHLQLNQAGEAEHDLQAFLDRVSAEEASVDRQQLQTAQQWLRYLLSVQLRLDERHQLLAKLHESGETSLAESKQYFFPRLLIWNSDTGWTAVRKYLKSSPADLLLNVAHSRYLIARGRLQEADRLLSALQQDHFSHPMVVVATLELNFERDDWKRIDETLQQFRKYHPEERNDPFVVRWLSGELALRKNHPQRAANLFLRALDSDPTNPSVHMGLLKAYNQLDRADKAAVMKQKSQALARIRVGMERVSETSPDGIQQLIDECTAAGFDEAATQFQRHLDRLKTSPDAPPGRNN